MLASNDFDQFNNPQHFEIHVTIYPTNDTEPFMQICNSFADHAKAFKDYKGTSFENAQVISCKPIIIVLPDGKYLQQPMCSTYIYGTLLQAVKYGEVFSDYVVKCHPEYKVSRNKVEARLRNVDDKITLDPSQPQFEGKYWEFHTKLSFDLKSIQSKISLTNKTLSQTEETKYFDDHIQSFREELMKNFPNCRLSKSALSNYDKTHSDNCTRIVTLRIYSGNKANATHNLDLLNQFLSSVSSKFDFEMRGDIEKELSVYDSNVKHDIGWISMIDVKTSTDDVSKTMTSEKITTKKGQSGNTFQFAALFLAIITIIYILTKFN